MNIKLSDYMCSFTKGQVKNAIDNDVVNDYLVETMQKHIKECSICSRMKGLVIEYIRKEYPFLSMFLK